MHRSSPDDSQKVHLSEFEYPTVEPLSMFEKLKMEQQATGMFISGHPLDEFAEEISRKTNYDIAKILGSEGTEPLADDTTVRVAGVITGVRKIMTRKEQQMAFLTLEDKICSIDVTVFPKAYESRGDRLQEGEVVVVYGKMNDGKLIANDIIFLTKN